MKYTILAFTLLCCHALHASEVKPVHKYVLTGGPGTGKTSLIALLHEQGYPTVQEVFGLLYADYERAGKVHELFSDALILRELLVAKQEELEAMADPEKPLFLDRAAPDTIFFGTYYDLQLSDEVIQRALDIPYQIVFIIEPLGKEQYEQTEKRVETYEESLVIHAHIKKSYQDHGYTVISIPADTLEARYQVILAHIV